MSYQDDKSWSDQYIPAIRAILGPCLLEPAPLYLDQNEGADIMTLHGKAYTTACRVRRPGWDKYPHCWQFIIRKQRESLVPTEFEKICAGYGDFYFYAHATSMKAEDGFSRWMIFSLDAFRAALIHKESAERIKRAASNHSGKDGTRFIAFDARTFPADFILASSHGIPHSQFI